MSRFVLSVVIGMMCLSLTGTTVQGDLIGYGDVSSESVSFLQITEDTFDGDANFGAPSGSSDALLFDGFGFQSMAENSIDFDPGRLSFIIEAHDGFMIDFLEIESVGSFFQFGSATASFVNTSAVIETEGVVESGNAMFESVGAGGGIWDSLVEFSVDQADRIRVVIDTQVFSAALGANQLAAVNVDAITVRVSTFEASAVPEPATAMFGFVSFGMFCLRRRRQTC